MRLILIVFLGYVIANQCLHPKGAQNYTLDAYLGQWYEIAKFQTAGGAFFEKNCVCTNLFVRQEDNIKVDNICNKHTPDGKLTVATGTLKEVPDSPGQYKSSFSALQPAIDYTIVLQGTYKGEEYSVEYDCDKALLTGLQYCVHFLSRKPTMSGELLIYLVNEVNKLNLNQNSLVLEFTQQDGCTYQQ